LFQELNISPETLAKLPPTIGTRVLSIYIGTKKINCTISSKNK
jgi:hypothetical protein